MSKRNETSEAIDIILKLLAVGTITGAVLVAPNAAQMLDKPLNKLFSKLDDREKARKLSKLRSYMKTQGLVRGDYDHGIELTKKAQIRLEKGEFDQLKMDVPSRWDGKWRLVMFDIPENKRNSRTLLTNKIQSLGFQLLQQSVWIHPFPCKKEIAFITRKFELEKWVTYIETDQIDNEKMLIRRFSKTLKQHRNV